MKKLSKLKLTNVDKEELEAKKMNLLKGGEECSCSCGCAANCSCTGEPISNQNTNSSFWSGELSNSNYITPSASDHGPY
jgi:natural product precursor